MVREMGEGEVEVGWLVVLAKLCGFSAGLLGLRGGCDNGDLKVFRIFREALEYMELKIRSSRIKKP